MSTEEKIALLEKAKRMVLTRLESKKATGADKALILAPIDKELAELKK